MALDEVLPVNGFSIEIGRRQTSDALDVGMKGPEDVGRDCAVGGPGRGLLEFLPQGFSDELRQGTSGLLGLLVRLRQ